jgi:hypothetical protein
LPHDGFFWAVFTKTTPDYQGLEAYRDALAYPSQGLSRERLKSLLATRAFLQANVIIPACFKITQTDFTETSPM